MKVFGGLVISMLTVAVAAEGVYIVQTRSQVTELRSEVARLAAPFGAVADVEERRAGFSGPRRDEPAPVDTEGTGIPARRPPPPQFVPTPGGDAVQPGAAPLPAAIASPEARDQMRQFVRSELEAERQEKRQKDEAQREERAQAFRDQVAQRLGLSPSEGEKFSELLTRQQTARQDLRQKMESGQVDRAKIGQEFATIRQQSDGEMKALLGDEKMQKYQDMSRQNGRGGPGEGPGGGGPPDRGGGRQRGGAPVPGGQPGGAPAPQAAPVP